MSYTKLISDGILNQIDLVDKLNISKQQVSRLLSFGKIPARIKKAIGDMSKVSARTAEQIKQLSAKGENYVDAIIKYSQQISEGKIGQKKLIYLVDKYLNFTTIPSSREKVFSANGKHLYTWRKDKDNNYLYIHFPKNITELITDGKLNKNQLNESLKTTLEELVMKIK